MPRRRGRLNPNFDKRVSYKILGFPQASAIHAYPQIHYPVNFIPNDTALAVRNEKGKKTVNFDVPVISSGEYLGKDMFLNILYSS